MERFNYYCKATEEQIDECFEIAKRHEDKFYYIRRYRDQYLTFYNNASNHCCLCSYNLGSASLEADGEPAKEITYEELKQKLLEYVGESSMEHLRVLLKDENDHKECMELAEKAGYDIRKDAKSCLCWYINPKTKIIEELSGGKYTHYIGSPIETISPEAFREFLISEIEKNKPKVRPMTKDEILELVAGNKIWVTLEGRKSCFVADKVDISSDSDLVFRANGSWVDVDSICRDYRYTTDFKTFHKFEVEV